MACQLYIHLEKFGSSQILVVEIMRESNTNKKITFIEGFSNIQIITFITYPQVLVRIQIRIRGCSNRYVFNNFLQCFAYRSLECTNRYVFNNFLQWI